MRILKIAICDDDILMLNAEKLQIENIVCQCGAVCEIDVFNNPENLTESRKKFDLCFLDVEMGNQNGIETAEALHNSNPGCLIFFVTNHESYMDEALNKHAFRFWTKPMDDKRLSYGIESAIKELRHMAKIITLTSVSGEIRLTAQNIVYMFVQKKKLHIITVNGEIVTNNTFETVEKQLKENQDFFEPHRSYMVNFRYVKNYEKDMIFCECNGSIYKVYLSRRNYAAFHKRFLEWVGGK